MFSNSRLGSVSHCNDRLQFHTELFKGSNETYFHVVLDWIFINFESYTWGNTRKK